jgi:electron transport complex protein RnfG
MKKDFLAPILALTLICLVITAALAATNSVTAPKIATDKEIRQAAMLAEIIPEAESFELVEGEALPASVTQVYETSNNVGYIFTVTAKGYGGEMQILCGISPEGKIIACKTLEDSETQGIGTRVTQGDFTETLVGKDASLEGVSAVSGATISSKAYLGAIANAFAAFEIVKGA